MLRVSELQATLDHPCSITAARMKAQMALTGEPGSVKQVTMTALTPSTETAPVERQKTEHFMFLTTTDMIRIGNYRIRVGAVGARTPNGSVAFRKRDLLDVTTGQAPNQGMIFSSEEILNSGDNFCMESAYSFDASPA